ncbi:hypothetical protein K4K56_012113 [Colletotrichum sp. SAR 10_98]|nr:hypothetical protein K4K56_012113 [Colletotrichum sp. SAR 10_98]
MASTEDEYIPGDRDALYSPGRSLVLTPHQAPPPYGHMYPKPHDLRPADMALSDDESVLSRIHQVFKETNRPHGFRETAQLDEFAQLHVIILKAIPGNRGQGDSSGPVNLLCRVTKASSGQSLSVGDLMFIKVFDPLLWWKEFQLLDRCLKVTTRADMAFCDEVGAYSFLQQKGLTGFPHLAPEVFGSWTAAVTSRNPDFEGQTRHVGVLALEYIDGIQLDKLFTPMERPRESSVQLYEDTDTPASFNTDEATRMDVMAKLLGGNMQQEFAGITHGDFHPRSVIVSMRNGNTILDSPRVRFNLDDKILRSEVRRQLEALVLVFLEDPTAVFPPVFADEAAPKAPYMKETEEAAQSARHRFNDMAVGHIHKTLSKAKRSSDPGVIVDASKLEEARLNGTSIIEGAVEDVVKNRLEQVLQSGDPSLEHFQKRLSARSTKMRILRPIEMAVRSTFHADASEKEPHQTSVGSASESHTLSRAFETLAIDPAQKTSVASEDID